MQSPDIVATFPSSIISLSENLFFISLIIFSLYLVYFFFYSAINLIKAVIGTVLLCVISYFVPFLLLTPLNSRNPSILDLLGDSPQIFSQRIIIGIIFVSIIRFFYILGQNKNTRNSRFFWAIVTHIPLILMMCCFTGIYSSFYQEKTADVFLCFTWQYLSIIFILIR